MPLRLVARRPPVIADVALFYGERSGGIRTYLDEKINWARRSGAIEHHLIVPGAQELHEPDGDTEMARHTRHELPSLRVAASNGYRIPLGARALCRTLRAIAPDVVLLHDPFWRPLGATKAAHGSGATVVAVHHGSSDLNAGAFPGPQALYRAGFRAWLRHAYAPLDALMSATDTVGDVGRAVDLPLRFGLHPAFRPRPGVRRGDHVLYAGRLAREKGIDTLLGAAALSADPWPLHLVGSGTAGDHVLAAVHRLGLEQRVSFRPFVHSREELARLYAEARCVVMPGPYETFGLVAFEAAASGAATVASETAPSARLLGDLCHTFTPRDARGLERAIARARAGVPDTARAARLAAKHTWDRAFTAELAGLARVS